MYIYYLIINKYLLYIKYNTYIKIFYNILYKVKSLL